MKKIKLITGRQLARLLGCDEMTIYRWKEAGKLRPVGQIGHSDVYDLDSIKKLRREIEKHQNDKRVIRIGPIIDVSKWFKRGKK